MNVDITNHLVPSVLVNRMLDKAKRDAWDTGEKAGWHNSHVDLDEYITNPHQVDE